MISPEQEAQVRRIMDAEHPICLDNGPKPTLYMPTVRDEYPKVAELALYGDWHEYAGVFWIQWSEGAQWTKVKLIGSRRVLALPGCDIDYQAPMVRAMLTDVIECVKMLDPARMQGFKGAMNEQETDSE